MRLRPYSVTVEAPRHSTTSIAMLHVEKNRFSTAYRSGDGTSEALKKGATCVCAPALRKATDRCNFCSVEIRCQECTAGSAASSRTCLLKRALDCSKARHLGTFPPVDIIQAQVEPCDTDV